MGSKSLNQTTSEVIEILSSVKIFSETSPEILAEIAGHLHEIKYRKGQNIFKKGDEGDAMYIIKSGHVRIHDGNHVLFRLSGGQVFGEFALFDKETRSASVTAEEDTVLWELGQDNFSQVMEGRLEVALGVLRKVIRRIREMNELEGKLAKSYIRIQNQKNEIEEQNRNILEQKAEMEKTNEMLIRLNDEKNQLISVVSHGLRNPLTSSLCVADLLDGDRQSFNEQQREYFDLIHSSLRRMNSLINQTLDIDVIELQREKLRFEIIDLAELLRQIGNSFKYTLKLKKLEIDMRLEQLFARVDKNYIYLVTDNILSNAIRFSPSNKKIYVDLFARDSQAVIEISDEGPGISDRALQTLFDNPRLHGRETDKTGLSVARKFTEAMGGQISCRSRQGLGTTFTIAFPSI